MDKRASGILLNVSSLPGQYGIGGFGKDAENFIDTMSDMGFSVWQTLPITGIGWGNSPYSGISTYAGNFLYIDPPRIGHELLTAGEVESATYKGEVYLTDYRYAIEAKTRLLGLAYSRVTPTVQSKIDDFVDKNLSWIRDYAVFMCLRKRFDNASWQTWPLEYRAHSEKLIERFIADNFYEVNYYYFEQFLFYEQWERIKAYAHNSGIKIFGDLPIYVSLDSVDVWANPKQFLLDKDYKPTMVAGVPPDYFCADGQLWGNPLYDYEAMALDGYSWWTDRIRHAHELYDYVRIDHFRGLYKYWAIDANATTAKEGEWRDGPQTALFDAINKAVELPKLIAEDLGQMDEDVHKFVANSGYYGMRVLQFGFDGDTSNRHLPHNYPIGCVAYTGTHDNDTTLGWLLKLDDETRSSVLEYLNCPVDYGWANGGGRCPATRAAIRAVLASSATLAIIPMQDLCGYGSDTRMNTPGVANGCWEYRTNNNAINNIDSTFIRKLNIMYGRKN